MSDIVEFPAVGGVYVHYKGGRYEVITLCTHTETDEVLVIYKSLLFGTVYARPLENWNTEVVVDSRKCKRFSRKS